MKAISTPPNKAPRVSERGNAFIFILIGIVMFTALAFTISRGMQSQNVSTMSARDAELAAIDIISYAQRLERAVDRVRKNGCSEGDISFENNSVAGYAHGSPVADKCKIFHPQGGAVSWQTPPVGANNGTPWFFGDNRVGDLLSSENIGTAQNELVMLLRNVNNTVCDKLNEKTNKFSVWESGGAHNQTAKFVGTFGTISNGINRGNSWPVPQSGCFCDTGGACTNAAPRYFYHILLVR